MSMGRYKQKGFTLIELVIVIAVLLVLTVLAVVSYGNFTENARNTALLADARGIIRTANTRNSLAVEKITKADITGGAYYDAATGIYDFSLTADSSAPPVAGRKVAGISAFDGKVQINRARRDDILTLINETDGFFYE